MKGDFFDMITRRKITLKLKKDNNGWGLIMNNEKINLVIQKKTRLENRKKEAETHANDSSEKTHRFFLIYIFLLAYVLVIVSSTTDLQLLLGDKGIILPILNVNVSLVGFYVIAPILITIMHVNLLLHLSITYKKLKYFSMVFLNRVPDIKIKNNILDTAVLSEKKMFSLLANILYIYSSPIVLLIIFFRFSDYQSTTIFTLHLLMIIIDIGFVINFGVSQKKIYTSHRCNSILFPFGGSFLLKSFIYLFFSILVIKSIVCWDFFIRDWRDSLSKDIMYHYYDDVDDDGSINDFYGLIPIIKIDRTTRLSNEEAHNYFGSLSVKKDTNSLHTFINKGMSIDLRNRSLRYAALPMQNLARAWFTNSDIQGANLLMSQLQGVVLSGTKLQGSNLSGSNLDGAYIFSSNLSGVNLSNTSMRGARVSDSVMVFTNFEGSDLSSSALSGNHFFAANLTKANLNSSFFVSNENYNTIFSNGEITIYDTQFIDDPFKTPTLSSEDVNSMSKEISSSQSRKIFLNIINGKNRGNPNDLIVRNNDKTNFNIIKSVCGNGNDFNDKVAIDYILGLIYIIDFEKSKNLLSYLIKNKKCKYVVNSLEENNFLPQGLTQ